MHDKKSVETILSELGKKIDHLIEETKKAGTRVSEETEQKISDLKAQKEKLEEELRDRASESGAKWNQARDHLNDAMTSINKAIMTLFKS